MVVINQLKTSCGGFMLGQAFWSKRRTDKPYVFPNLTSWNRNGGVLCGDSAWQIGVKNGILSPVLFGFKFNVKVARWEFGMKSELWNFKFLWSVTYAWAQKPPADLFLSDFTCFIMKFGFVLSCLCVSISQDKLRASLCVPLRLVMHIMPLERAPYFRSRLTFLF
jgi:hypothetical protein